MDQQTGGWGWGVGGGWGWGGGWGVGGVGVAGGGWWWVVWGQVFDPQPKHLMDKQYQTLYILAEYPSWECKHRTRNFHSNDFIPLFSKTDRGQKYHWKACKCGHITLI